MCRSTYDMTIIVAFIADVSTTSICGEHSPVQLDLTVTYDYTCEGNNDPVKSMEELSGSFAFKVRTAARL